MVFLLRMARVILIAALSLPLSLRLLHAQSCASIPATGAVVMQVDTSCLSLDQAIGRALNQSPDVRIARNGLDQAEAQIKSLIATAYPRINGSAAYVRTFASPFQTKSSGPVDTTAGFHPDTTASLEERVRYLEKNPNLNFGSLFGSLPFGQANSYSFAVSGSQTLYNGGKFRAIFRLRDNYREQAQLTYEDAAAGVEQAIHDAYVRTSLARSLEEIANASVAQAERFANQVRLQRESGKASDLDVMRAEVALENLKPQAVTAHRSAELALLDLKRRLDLPLGLPLKLTSPLQVPDPDQLVDLPADPNTVLHSRPAVKAQQRQVDITGDLVIVTRAAHRPQVNLSMNYGKQIYPTGVFGFAGQQWRTDWSTTLALSLPIFEGGAGKADVQRAQLTYELEKIRLEQTLDAVELQYQQALGNREAAATTIIARQRTVDQAQQVYDLTVLRFESGVSTQLEVSDARLALLQARTNLAQATADLLIADAGVARALGSSSISGGTY